MVTLASAGLFLSGFVTGFLAFWLRWYFRRSWTSAFTRRRHSMRHRQDYLIRLSGRGRRQIRGLGRYYGHLPRFSRREFL